MPIYDYIYQSCGLQKEVLQEENPLTHYVQRVAIIMKFKVMSK